MVRLVIRDKLDRSIRKYPEQSGRVALEESP